MATEMPDGFLIMARHDLIRSDIDIPFRFVRKPMSLPPELRPDWKISILLLILEISSHQGKSSLRRLHMLNWSMRSTSFKRDLEDRLKTPVPLFRLSVRFEPAFSRAIDLAVGRDLVEWVGGNRLKITSRGKTWVAAIQKDALLMVDEKQFLRNLGKSITEKLAEEMFGHKGS